MLSDYIISTVLFLLGVVIIKVRDYVKLIAELLDKNLLPDED